MKNFLLPENRGANLSRRDGYEVSVENSLVLLHANKASQAHDAMASGMEDSTQGDMSLSFPEGRPVSLLLHPLFHRVLPGYVLIWLALMSPQVFALLLPMGYRLNDTLADVLTDLLISGKMGMIISVGRMILVSLALMYFFAGVIRVWKNIPFLPSRLGLAVRLVILLPLIQFFSGLMAGLTRTPL